MPPDGGSPTLRRWELSNTLRELRLRSGLNGDEVAARIVDTFADSFSPAKLSRIENDQQVPHPRDVSELAFVYDVVGEERDRLIQLAREAKRPSWVQSYGAVEAKYRTYADLESAASRINNYESTFVGGLLQTPAYAEAVIRGLNPGDPDARIAELLELRLKRQERLHAADPPEFHLILQENCLRRTIGDKRIMADQIAHLREAADWPHVTVQVIRFDAGVYQGLTAAALTILEFPIAGASSTVCYLEGILWNLFADDQAQKDRIRAAFEEMRHQVALSPEETRDFLVKIHDRVTSEAEGR
jgi:transcriptional regulator with XRE-family HTH domain